MPSPRRFPRAALVAVVLVPVALAAPYVARCAAAALDARAGKNARPAAASAALVAPAPTPPPAALAAKLQLTPIVRHLEHPVDLKVAPGDPSGRLFVVEQPGRIRIVKNGAVASAPFLDFTRRTSRSSEQGLLGLAFHPDYAKNGRFFVSWTDKDGDSHVTELRVDPKDPDRADPTSEKDWFTVDQPYANHNGGNLVFGPDGQLWIGFGDGGAANDPRGNGQKDGVRLAHMLRLDVDRPGSTPTIHWKGLRNPWRYSFDRKTGDLYLGDVGQDLYEEIDVVAAAETKKPGLDFGWNLMEGLHCFGSDHCDAKGLVLPVVEYAHADGTGCSVTGGVVYRGKALPELDGMYFYADYCTAMVRSFRWSAAKLVEHYDWKAALDPKHQLATLAAFGEDAAGEIYLVSHDGVIYRLERRP